MGYTKYAWVGNRISDEDMANLYRMKLRTHRPITALVAEAVSNYVLSHRQEVTAVSDLKERLLGQRQRCAACAMDVCDLEVPACRVI
jgi:hypothetical protein